MRSPLEFLRRLRRDELRTGGSSGGSVQRRAGGATAAMRATAFMSASASTATSTSMPAATSASAPPAASGATLTQFHQVPAYQSLLTVGPEAIYRLPAELNERLIALDCGARQVRLVRATMRADERAAIDGTARALRGALRTRGYAVLDELVAEPHVLREILRNAGSAGKAGARGAPLLVFERWVALALAAGATDLHVEVRGHAADVRVRVDGRMEPLPDGQGGRSNRKEAIDAVAAGYNSTRTGNNVSQYHAGQFVDCMIDLDLPGAAGQLRYQNLKGRLGPKTVVRILRTGDDRRIGLDQAGYAPSHQRLLRLAARAGKGIVLLSGVTSSGKSTSLKAFIETLPGLAQKAIYTVEDPVEVEIAGAHQIEVLRDIADEDETRRRYAEVMRALMRADPDGVMLGEVRDRLTALFALQIAETGHLAMGTVHAHLVSNIVPRLTNDQIGVSRQALTGPNILNLLVYQALVPRLCRHCALTTSQASEVDADVREIDEVLRRRFRLAATGLRWTRPGGCTACGGRGTSGKTLVAEMLQPDRTWLRLVREGDDDAALQHFRSTSDRRLDTPDMTGKTVFEHALHKALRGEIDVRHCEEFDSFERFELPAADDGTGAAMCVSSTGRRP